MLITAGSFSFLTLPDGPEHVLLSLPQYGALLKVNLKSQQYSVVGLFENIKGIHSLKWVDEDILFFANEIRQKDETAVSGLIQIDSQKFLIKKIIKDFAGEQIYSKTRGSVSPIGSDSLLVSLGNGDFFVYSTKSGEKGLSGKIKISDASESFLKKVYSLEFVVEAN